jgi:hypothetical protein
LSEKRNALLRLLKNEGFKKEKMTKVGVYVIGTSTTRESNKSLLLEHTCRYAGEGASYIIKGMEPTPYSSAPLPGAAHARCEVVNSVAKARQNQKEEDIVSEPRDRWAKADISAKILTPDFSVS